MTMYYLDIIILKLGKAAGMSGECVAAAYHFCSLSWDRGPDNPGRPDVPEVSLQPLRENVIMRSLPPFFFHILARNWHPICNWNHRIKTYLWSQKDYTIIFSEMDVCVTEHQGSCLCGILSSAFDFLMNIFGYCFFLINCQTVILSSFPDSHSEDSEYIDPIPSNNILSAPTLSPPVVSFISGIVC